MTKMLFRVNYLIIVNSVGVKHKLAPERSSEAKKTKIIYVNNSAGVKHKLAPERRGKENEVNIRQ